LTRQGELSINASNENGKHKTVKLNFKHETRVNDSLEIGFNYNYLVDAIQNTNKSEKNVVIKANDQNTSILIESKNGQFVVMPMRL
jgi:DNA polymerase III sliding clamp (beta) subunit (PCNA family)